MPSSPRHVPERNVALRQPRRMDTRVGTACAASEQAHCHTGDCTSLSCALASAVARLSLACRTDQAALAAQPPACSAPCTAPVRAITLNWSSARAGSTEGFTARGSAAGASEQAPDGADHAHVLAQAVGRAGRSGSALSEADSQAAEAAAGPPLVVFSGGTAFNSVAGARRRPPLPGPPGERGPSCLLWARCIPTLQAHQAAVPCPVLRKHARSPLTRQQRLGRQRGPPETLSAARLFRDRAQCPGPAPQPAPGRRPPRAARRAGHLRTFTTRVAHVLPVSDDGGSTAEIVRVLGGPAVGDIRSRCLRLADDRDAEVAPAAPASLPLVGLSPGRRVRGPPARAAGLETPGMELSNARRPHEVGALAHERAHDP